jgi:hypothetical protein
MERGHGRRLKLRILYLRSNRASAITSGMSTVLRYRGRAVTESEVFFIRERIASEPKKSRRALSLELCAAWNWVQANGHPRDMVCRGLLLALHRAGRITLPPPRRAYVPLTRCGARREPPPEGPPVRGKLSDLGPLTFRRVRRTPEESLFNGLLRSHHYLGYAQPVGEHLKFLVSTAEQPLACFAWSSAPRHLGPRDRYIGWPAADRRRNIRYVAYNSRFLILPWVEVPHLASHLLGRMVRMLSAEWEQVYGHPVHLAETFVDPTRWRGTCYRAANWTVVGRTTGRGNNDRTNRPNRSRKDVLVYPLISSFRTLLAGE